MSNNDSRDRQDWLLVHSESRFKSWKRRNWEVGGYPRNGRRCCVTGYETVTAPTAILVVMTWDLAQQLWDLTQQLWDSHKTHWEVAEAFTLSCCMCHTRWSAILAMCISELLPFCVVACAGHSSPGCLPRLTIYVMMFCDMLSEYAHFQSKTTTCAIVAKFFSHGYSSMSI